MITGKETYKHVPNIWISHQTNTQGTILETSALPSFLNISSSFENSTMQSRNPLSLLGIDPQVLHRGLAIVRVILGNNGRICLLLWVIISCISSGCCCLVFKILFPGTVRVGGYQIDMGKDDETGPPRYPLVHFGVRGCLGGPSIANFDDHIDRLKSLFQEPLRLGNMAGIPLNRWRRHGEER